MPIELKEDYEDLEIRFDSKNTVGSIYAVEIKSMLRTLKIYKIQ